MIADGDIDSDLDRDVDDTEHNTQLEGQRFVFRQHYTRVCVPGKNIYLAKHNDLWIIQYSVIRAIARLWFRNGHVYIEKVGESTIGLSRFYDRRPRNLLLEEAVLPGDLIVTEEGRDTGIYVSEIRCHFESLESWPGTVARAFIFIIYMVPVLLLLLYILASTSIDFPIEE